MERFTLPSMHELCLKHSRADRALRTIVSTQLEAQTLTMMEWLALGVIAEADRGGFSMSQVADALDVTLPQVTALVTSLVKMRLVKQKILFSDRRGRQVQITSRGRRLLSKLESHISKAVKVWTKDVPRTQLQTYILTVDHLSQISNL